MGIEAEQAKILARHNITGSSSLRPMRHVVDAVAVILALVCILFAAVQFGDSRDLKGKTEAILASTTTRYVANFPENIPEITTLIGGTCANLDIMADLPGYGMYSNPKAFLEYKAAILGVGAASLAATLNSPQCVAKKIDARSKRTGSHPKVRLLLFAPEDRLLSLKNQLERREFLQNVSTPGGQKQLEAFLDMNREPLNGLTVQAYAQRVRSGAAYEGLLQYIVESQGRYESEFHNQGIAIRYARSPANQLRAWIQDSDDAAFSFDHQPEAGGETEIAFRTRDASLLSTFKQIFDSRWNDAVCYSDYWLAQTGSSRKTAKELKAGCTSSE